ncbi:MAG: glycosyltransferase family 4 protein [Acidimicrobiales bacterium]
MSDADVKGRNVVLAGVSRHPVCGVRDHTYALAEGFSALGESCDIVWEHVPTSLSPLATAQALRSWARAVSDRSRAASALIVQYSAFSYSYRGVSVGFLGWTSTLRQVPCPKLAYLHEPAHAWTANGARGWVWALSQRAALRSLVGAVDAVALTTEPRLQWQRSRRWLPPRPSAFAPVSSTLPSLPAGVEEPAASPNASAEPRIGVLGYGPTTRPAPVLSALRRLRAEGLDANLVLLGGPGPSSVGADRWRVASEETGVSSAVSWTGVLPAAELASAMAGCHALVFSDASGASGRRTSVAAPLALGVPVVALDGPETWPLLADRGAAVIVPPEPDAIANALRPHIADPQHRRAQADRGRAFYASELGAEVVAARLLRTIAAVRSEAVRS